eukprot:CAMPEP_0194778612 /NCGR_PEP_ID=MMETSP0323_2-20130528/68670_1 /TAXON_ID=2866 ORGANISM="Crypthecodinium cohnii, Strain Seligo" /NCGR_SAMPLE_ID=MMETSP0323_2 /ASSEMBLY_ACC=CAM_ASM_000346 /LENGTH=45 /DNA_ID= /DNA_START= /DNA_END= /DNA_ORIENTATION=
MSCDGQPAALATADETPQYVTVDMEDGAKARHRCRIRRQKFANEH